MKIFFLLIYIFIFTLLSCTSNNTIKSYSGRKYFNLYSNIIQPEKELYNIVANICRNTLIKYVEETYPSYPDLIGLVLELEIKGHKKIFQDIMNSKIYRGWSVFDSDMIPITQEDIDNLNILTGDPNLLKAPKAKFYIKITDNNAVAYVSYWIQQYKIYNYIYYFEKSNGWNLSKTEIIE